MNGDPVNRLDPTGLDSCGPGVDFCIDVWGGGGGWSGGFGHGVKESFHLEMFASMGSEFDGGGAMQVTSMTVGGLTFANWGNTGTRQDTIVKRLKFISNNIDSDCSKWLLSNSTYQGIGDYINTLLENNLVGYADVTSSTGVNNASIGSGVGGFALVVNTGGSFFNSNAPRSTGVEFGQQIGRIASGSDRSGVFTLIHELAHSLSASGFREDGGNQDAVNRNNDDVWKNCNKTIMGAGNRP